MRLRDGTNTTATFARATRASRSAGCGGKAITEAKGAVVPDEFYRTGRGHRRADGRGDCTRPRVRQRKAALTAAPCHPELAAAYASLMGPASARAGLKGGV